MLEKLYGKAAKKERTNFLKRNLTVIYIYIFKIRLDYFKILRITTTSR